MHTTIAEAQKWIGHVVVSDCGICGILEYVKADGWAGVRDLFPWGGIDEIQVSRIRPDPT